MVGWAQFADVAGFPGLGRLGLGLAALALAGRVVLAWLPAGRLGSHRTHELPRTASASLFVGVALAALFGRIASALQSALWPSDSEALAGGTPAAAPELAPELWLGFALAIGLAFAVRLASLPGAMDPRHEPAHERPGAVAQIAGLAIVAVFGLALARCCAGGAAQASAESLASAPPQAHVLALLAPRGADPRANALAAWMFLAALFVLADDGLRVARRAPLGGRLALLAAALATWGSALGADLERPTLSSNAAGWHLVLAGGVIASFAWLRRGDRRAFALALLGLGAAAAWSDWAAPQAPLAVGSAAALGALVVVATPRPSRAKAALRAGALALVVAVALALGSFPFAVDGGRSIEAASAPPAHPGSAALVLLSLATLPALFAALAGVRGCRWRPRPAAGRIDEPGRELVVALGAVAVLGSACACGFAFERGLPFAAGLPALLPLAFVATALVFVRAERPGAEHPGKGGRSARGAADLERSA